MTKLTQAQLSQAQEMYDVDRKLDIVYKKGRYTLKQIREALGIGISLVAIHKAVNHPRG